MSSGYQIAFLSIAALAFACCAPKNQLPPQAATLKIAMNSLSLGVDQVELPVEYKHLSDNGCLYFTRTPKTNFVLWRTTVGRHGHFHGVVYWTGDVPNKEKVELFAPSSIGIVKWHISSWRDGKEKGWGYVSTDFSD